MIIDPRQVDEEEEEEEVCVLFFFPSRRGGLKNMQRQRPEFVQVVDFDALDIFGVDEASLVGKHGEVSTSWVRSFKGSIPCENAGESSQNDLFRCNYSE